ncbi:MAG TPA: choice-of-anchor tandem repeat GloVer-containing protein [Candidatus Acidoferrales bacterium]|nr:choice-of-anchor tandem repeat GloVer-containing protein [Candidatus Acidoferrales bacterium]
MKQPFYLIGICLGTTIVAACGGANVGAPPAAQHGALLSLAATQPVRPPKERVLWNFTGGADGGDPIGGVIADAAGNLYGGTIGGGAPDQGTIFELTPIGRKYAEKTLVTFNGRNGSSSSGALAMDASGALFGTTVWGGAYGYGAAFRLTMKGGVRERVIWSFGGNLKDGANPDAGMVLDANGALYGTTSVGGAFGGGIAFKLTPSGRAYAETIMRAFGGDSDGKYPAAPLTLVKNGVLYGTAGGGGNGCSHGCGIVFKLTPSGTGYSESKVYTFKGGSDGSGPSSGLTFDSSGAMYGVTDYGGGGGCADGYGCGTVYKLTPSGSGYTERVLWVFGSGTDGYYPMSNVVIGRGGTLYGTTWQGGSGFGGVVYELVPNGSNYEEKVLMNFVNGADGYDPRGNLFLDRDHRLVGSTYVGGSSEFPDGTVFRFTP